MWLWQGKYTQELWKYAACWLQAQKSHPGKRFVGCVEDKTLRDLVQMFVCFLDKCLDHGCENLAGWLAAVSTLDLPGALPSNRITARKQSSEVDAVSQYAQMQYLPKTLEG